MWSATMSNLMLMDWPGTRQTTATSPLLSMALSGRTYIHFQRQKGMALGCLCLCWVAAIFTMQCSPASQCQRCGCMLFQLHIEHATLCSLWHATMHACPLPEQSKAQMHVPSNKSTTSFVDFSSSSGWHRTVAFPMTCASKCWICLATALHTCAIENSTVPASV